MVKDLNDPTNVDTSSSAEPAGTAAALASCLAGATLACASHLVRMP